MGNIKAFRWVMILGIILGMIACKKSNAENTNKEIAISNATTIKARFAVNDEGEQERLVFVKKNPSFIVELTNDTAVNAEASIVLNIQTVVQRETPPLYTQTLLDTVPKNTKNYNHKVSISVPDNILSPGFYRVSVLVNGVEAQAKDLWVGLSKPVIGVKPLQMIVDNTDKPTDFDVFWNNALNELSTIPLNAVETKVSENDTRTMYRVTLDSWNGGKVIGYLSIPKSGGKHPAILTSNGYSVVAAMPTRTDEFIEFDYNVRGQGLNNDLGTSTTYPNITWFVRGLETNDKDKYYYKGAYLDVVRAIDYLYSRADVDQSKVFAQGESQGGALTFVAAALGNNRIKAAAASVPFLSYFKAYYPICKHNKDITQNSFGWPMNELDSYITWKGLNLDNVMKLFSYFDIKNLASKVICPLIMNTGLQDGTCPPTINFAAFNNLSSTIQKQAFINYNYAHNESTDFRSYKVQFFRKF